MSSESATWERLVRDVPDFPEPGIVFKDITPLLGNAAAFRGVIDALVACADGREVDKVVGIEARGFTFAAAVAYQMNAGLVPVRKPGKLPYETITESYELEYGVDSLEIHEDGIAAGEAVYVIDDVLATGGTASATCRLVEHVGGRVSALAFVAELGFLNGRAKLATYNVQSLMTL